ncbi:MAG TPA: 3' terminal RNA ribose 2'-O-methyltransferase Hen1 [Bryobacteraceae bacterium]|nr:3' terminal RNA ribose 2'-O-methyltransferase Hen1 [Bryobacteraceae bacterium]
MLLSISSSAPQATDLGYLLHKNPANLHEVDLSFGKAYVFYSEASAARCTACLLIEIDPVHLVRGSQQIENYVNDRPYVASSFTTVAIGRVFGTALAGNCNKRPDLVATKLPLELIVEVVRSRAGAELVHKLFEPLGYRVGLTRVPLDSSFPEWGDSPYYRLTLQAEVTVQDLLSHLYVLLPVLDEEKHYYLGDSEVDKLLRHGERWLPAHPEQKLIVNRYLRRWRSLTDQAFARLLDQEALEVESGEAASEGAAKAEKDLERPLTLHTQRLNLVAATLKNLNVHSVLDLGCGEGKLLRRLMADRSFDRIAGMDVGHKTLEAATARLRVERLPERQRRRIELFQGSLLYRDSRLSGFDAAALVEVIEHLDASRLSALERVVFEFARPRHVVVTTPNREFNVLFPTLPSGRFRHSDHRFEWTRGEFAAWSSSISARFGYGAQLVPIGPEDPVHGAPSQMAVFTLRSGSAQ